MKRIPINSEHGIVGYALVDDADYEALARYSWCRGGPRGMYVRRGSPQGNTYMHRQIMGLAHGDEREADHINGDKRDNRRQNLRIIPHRAQTQNVAGRGKSPLRGAVWDKRRGKWIARAGGKHLGRFNTDTEAAAVAAAWRAEHMPYSREALERAA